MSLHWLNGRESEKSCHKCWKKCHQIPCLAYLVVMVRPKATKLVTAAATSRMQRNKVLHSDPELTMGENYIKKVDTTKGAKRAKKFGR